jgi:DNA anti-recombination protein RmuC
MSPVFKIKTIPALIPTTLMMLVMLSGCEDDGYKRNDVRNKDEKPGSQLEDKADRQENKAERLEDKAERIEQRSDQMQNKADETRDTTTPSVGERIEDRADKLEDRIDERVDDEGRATSR